MKEGNKKTHAWGIASLILGILSILIFLMPYFGLPLAITAVVFYGIQKKHEPTSIATGGLITGIIGIIINGVILLFIVGLLAMIGGVSSDNPNTISDHESIETTLEDSTESAGEDSSTKEEKYGLLGGTYLPADVKEIIVKAKEIANNPEKTDAFLLESSVTSGDSRLIVLTPYSNGIMKIADMIEKYDEYTEDTVKRHMVEDGRIYASVYNIDTKEMYMWDTGDLRAVIEYEDGKICRGKVTDVESNIGDLLKEDYTYETSIAASYDCFYEVYGKDVRFVFVADDDKVYFDVPLKDFK